ncbi:MAG: alpha-L-arabinofuranosidase C-terminal domain-containing protein [Candidatus Solibacter sp.]
MRYQRPIRLFVFPAVALVATAFVAFVRAQPAIETIAVQVNRPGAAVSPTLFGLFFEDINFAADGGLYPELVKNRSFEFTEPLAGWSRPMTAEGQLIALAEGGLNENNPHYLRMRSEGASGFGITNGGFRGIGVEAGKEYVFSAWVRTPGGAGPKSLRGALLGGGGGRGGGKLGEATLTGFSGQWKRYEAVLKAATTTPNARLQVSVSEPGDLDIDMVSLFPKDTWKGRPNGLRRDLVQLLADMKPGFLRFPGGCIVEGRRLALRYQWKKTVGDVSERRSIINRWSDENARVAPDYFQSFGLGFYEYFQLSEDIGASPLPILNCGMACQFNSSEMAAMDQLDEYVRDALDLIEFANGGTDTAWGGLRARLGHPAPFNLKMIGIGNEQWGKAYVDRYKVFSAAIKAKYPAIQLITSAGPSPSGAQFDFLWGEMRKLKADLVDEHYYQPPQWFLDNSHRYDNYDRNGPKVFAGEYAAHTPEKRNTWGAALAEAAFMTGLERNSDVVQMASYAPMLAHVDAWQWAPDLIWFDNLKSFGTPSYYVQKLFAANLGNRILPVTVPNGLYASALLDEKSGEVILKVVNAGNAERGVRISLGDVKGAARAWVLSSELASENSVEKPLNVAPVERSSGLDLSLAARSLTVLRVPVR